MSTSTVRALAPDLTMQPSPLPGHATTTGQAGTKNSLDGQYVCLLQQVVTLIISYSYTMALRGLNGTKTLSNTILYNFKVTLNVHYIEK